jgi:succinyl-diaminopimelate desuccinylase
MGTGRAELLGEVETRLPQLVDLCCELLRTPSPNPPGDTRAITALIERRLMGAGLAVERYAPKADSPNLVAHLEGAVEGPSLLLNGHLDHFPPATGEWSSDPYGGGVVGNRVIGVGATDMRAGLAVAIYLAEIFAASPTRLAGRLTLLVCSDEETGGVWGTEWVLANVPGVHADACLIGDQSGSMSVAVGEKGVCWLRLTARGQRGHGAYASHTGAVRVLLPILLAIAELDKTRWPLPAGLDVREEDGRELVESVTVNIASLHAGEKINLAPDLATAEVDIRIPVGMSVADVLEPVKRIIADAGSAVEITELMTREPNLTDPSAAVVHAALKNAATVAGQRTPRAIVRVGSSDARFFRVRGIPTIIVGASPATMGGVDEHVTVEELRELALIHAGVVIDTLGVRDE